MKCDVRLPYRMYVASLHFVFTLFGVSSRDNLFVVVSLCFCVFVVVCLCFCGGMVVFLAWCL